MDPVFFYGHGIKDNIKCYDIKECDEKKGRFFDAAALIILREIGWFWKTRKCGITFRRTIGKWLLESSVDAQMISQVLGHRDGEILKRYLPLSLDLLRECALDFTYAPLEEGVYK